MITKPKGFLAAGAACGIKKSGKPDMALIVSKIPAAAAAVFTSNQYKAAPVIADMKQVRSGLCQAIIINAGNANCGTGEKGLADAYRMINETASALTISSKHVMVASTGSIRHFLPMDKIVAGISKLSQKISVEGGEMAARAILTTDTRKKEIAVKIDGYTIAGICKGSGMIHPNMATMLGFITTDAAVDRKTLQSALKKAVDISFNMITVDQCQSTNDSVFIMANGLSGIKIEGKAKKERFEKALIRVCIHLAKEIARDGEGATQLMEVKVSGARNEKEGRVAARAIAGSDLLKCAVYGRDYNLGRILAAVGSTSVRQDQKKIKADMKFKKGMALITCNLGAGKAEAIAWGCDMTEGYIKINAEYHT
ncbi:MAG TPA: bifunctional glutamate N-acetyltransferase/amino-acid acetyltransferase ArgJ [Candidatus Omnitrophota bacterium]|nr:bifunctional glutamate N-acetyltransferase/amino-acid acetyltransferase ArgJ [Candidatus Omnitrophota bacterium]